MLSERVACPIARFLVAAMSKRHVTSSPHTPSASCLNSGSKDASASSKKTGAKSSGHLYLGSLSSIIRYNFSSSSTLPSYMYKNREELARYILKMFESHAVMLIQQNIINAGTAIERDG